MTNQHPPTSPTSDAPPDGVAVLRALAALDLDGVAMTIRQLRTRSNQPAQTLASLVGVTTNAWRQWETGATHPRADHLFRLGAVATQQALPATSHHHGVQVLCDLAALGPAGLATAIRTIRQQTGDTPTQLAARIGVDPTSVHGWTAGRHTPQLPHLVGLGKLRGPTSPPRLASLPYLTLAQVAALFHVHKYTVIRWAESGKLPSVLVNSHRCYRPAAVIKLARDRNIDLPAHLDTPCAPGNASSGPALCVPLAQVTALLDVNEPTVTRWVDTGKLPYRMIRGRRHYPISAIAELARDRNIALPDWLLSIAATAQQAPP